MNYNCNRMNYTPLLHSRCTLLNRTQTIVTINAAIRVIYGDLNVETQAHICYMHVICMVYAYRHCCIS